MAWVSTVPYDADVSELRIVRETDRFEACCHFYGDVLGWPVTKEWDEPAPGRIFGFGDSARIEFLTVADGTAVAPAGVLLSVEVDDVAAVHDALVAAGEAVTQPLGVQPWGHHNFAVTDPTGTTVVFFEVIS